MDNSELPENIKKLLAKAESGDPIAQFNLGVKYRAGREVEQNDKEAIRWFSKSAKQGYASAQCNLGWMYRNGYGVQQNDSEAITWYRKAAEQDNAQAINNLGWMHHTGRGVKKNIKEAINYYRKAADLNNADAQNNLGAIYETGRYVEKNDNTAINYYRKAAEKGHKTAQHNLGLKYYLGRGVVKNYREAAKWYQKAAEQGDVDAQYMLGKMYEKGLGIKKSERDAFSWYHKAAEQGNADAQSSVGWMYANGCGVALKTNEAINWFRRAATPSDSKQNFKAMEYQDQLERYELSPKITTIRKNILDQLTVDIDKIPTMTHYTSLVVGNSLLFDASPLRLGHISALNDPNEGKLLWRYLEHTPIEGKPVFVGCFLPDDDSLNMWRFYSKNHQNDDACGCAITFITEKFFDFHLLKEPLSDIQRDENNDIKMAFSNTGRSPKESATFYRIIYISDDMKIHGDDKKHTLKNLFALLKEEVDKYLNKRKIDDTHLQKLSRLLGPLPYLLKDADYESEKEHRIIVTHLEYGAKEIKSMEPSLENGIPQTAPRLYLELHRANHLDPVKHVTLGPKSPHQKMMGPYWHHQLASEFSEQLKAKTDFYIRASKCAYQ
ncbi:tetratricopeptide repeat protein [Aeromonas caviae]|uniref:tetratricopeptide repeat protein n=1 Tax=Aeromonas caviae TaxID=648 RepID=UPI0029D504EA|nr:tetratricopeptide repeat protein [Aeromonas caviae]MDX7826431.1 tetratricopeptide repeat protein [Aeromonas caviae]